MAAIEGEIRPYAIDIGPTAPVVLSPVVDPPDNGTFVSGSHVASPGPGEVRALLSAVRERQDKEDLVHDTAVGRRVIEAALQTGNDSAMIDIL